MSEPYRIDTAARRAARLVEAHGALFPDDDDAGLVSILRSLCHASSAEGASMDGEMAAGVIIYRRQLAEATAALARAGAHGPGTDSDAPWATIAQAVRNHYRTPPDVPPLKITLGAPAGPRGRADAGELLGALQRTVRADMPDAAGWTDRAHLLADVRHLCAEEGVDLGNLLAVARDRFRSDLLGPDRHTEATVRERMPALVAALDAGDVISDGEWDEAVAIVEDIARRREAWSTADDAPLMTLDEALFSDR